VYLNETGATRFTAAEVGTFLRTASHHYVIDTPAARASSGVWLEHSIADKFQRGKDWLLTQLDKAERDAKIVRDLRDEHSRAGVPTLTDEARIVRDKHRSYLILRRFADD
jgi:hypothetical protein